MVKVDASLADVKEWLSQKMGEELEASDCSILLVVDSQYI